LRNKLIIVILSISLFFAGCFRPHSSYVKPVKTNAGKQSIYLSEHKVNIDFYGDYLFHPLKASQTPYHHKEYIQIIRSIPNYRLLFCAHTIIKPYCTTYGIWYKNSNRDSLASKLVLKLRESGNSENIVTELTQLGKVYYSKINYDLYNSKYGLFIHYAEFISEQGRDVYRITFSTADSNLDWFQNECEGIISSMEFR